MASYSVFLTRSGARELEDFGSDDYRRRIADRICGLADDPRPTGSATLAGRRDRLRFRQGHYRIVYSVDDPGRIVTIVRITHRCDVYRSGR